MLSLADIVTLKHANVKMTPFHCIFFQHFTSQGQHLLPWSPTMWG